MAINLLVELRLGVFYPYRKQKTQGMLKSASPRTETETSVQNIGAQIRMPSKKVVRGIQCQAATEAGSPHR